MKITFTPIYDADSAITDIYADSFPETIHIAQSLLDVADSRFLSVTDGDIHFTCTNGNAIYRIVSTWTLQGRWDGGENEETFHVAKRVSVELKDD